MICRHIFVICHRHTNKVCRLVKKKLNQINYDEYVEMQHDFVEIKIIYLQDSINMVHVIIIRLHVI